MMDFFRHLFDTSGFPPRWTCGQWSEAHGWLHILSDLAIFGAYSAIPLTLVYFLRRRRDVPFVPIFGLFAAFIILCGLTHLIEATIFWHPWYRLSGLLKVITAVVSWLTVAALFKVIPQALSLPGLAKVNRLLRLEISERQLVEEGWRRERGRLAVALRAGQMGVYDWEMKKNTLWWSPETYTLFGVDPAEFSPSMDRFTELIHPDDRHQVWQHLEGCLSRREHFEHEFRIVRPDGSIRWIANRAEFEYDEEGMGVRSFGVALDITPQKAADAALRENAQLFATIIKQAPGGVYVVDAQFRMQSLNSEALTVFAPVHPLIGRDFREVLEILWGEKTGSEVASIFHHTLTTGERYLSTQFSATREDLGLEQAYEWETQRIMLPDGQHGVVCYFTDVTERRRAENALQQAKEGAETANRHKDHFLAVLSHELRTPLTPVLMAVSELEQDAALPEQVRTDLAMVKRNVQLETKLIDDLLDLSRITSGKVELRKETVNIHDLIREVGAICRPELVEGKLHLELEEHPGAILIFADPARLQQVLWNILRNAIKFTAPGGGITVTTHRSSTGGCGVAVRDTGIGIAPEVLPLVFNAFEQGEASITRQFGGLGLGLAISRALVELHGGTIRAESAGTGKGATFIVELPPGAACPPAPVDTGTEAVVACLPQNSIRVLLVEDHADTLRTLGRLLRNRGLTVVTAATVRAALECAKRESFDIVVSDLGLPDGSGYDVIAGVRELVRIPGIAMSGYGMEEDLRRSAEAGFSEHLIKPISFKTLMASIRRLTGPDPTDQEFSDTASP